MDIKLYNRVVAIQNAPFYGVYSSLHLLLLFADLRSYVFAKLFCNKSDENVTGGVE
ncbi:MAG: hypothetical protein KAT65_02980 [Methanophagales archaeon]|nr:hypothetical protein [Methanophagales archaeon]